MKIGVMMGGTSSEREVSLCTGREIIEGLDKNKYEVIPMEINGKMEVFEKAKEADFIFLALHGAFGEDGEIQSILEAMDKPYSGCSPLSSCICMDKEIAKRLIKGEGIPTADWVVIGKSEETCYEKIEKLGYPMVVKPNSGGSSVATSIVYNREELVESINIAFRYDKEVMLEQYVDGQEITCPILNGCMLPILSIQPQNKFFDYFSKYSDGGAKEERIELPKEVFEKIQNIALQCYKILKCSVYARVDIIVKDNIPYVLEVNTLPGMTKNSLLPKSAKSAGISFTQLLDQIIEFSL